MSWQEEAREPIASVRELRAGLAFGLPDDVPQSKVVDAILDALAPVVKAEVARAKAEALREAVQQDAITIPDTLGYKVTAVATEDLLDRADAIEAEAEGCGHPNHGSTDHDCRPFVAEAGER